MGHGCLFGEIYTQLDFDKKGKNSVKIRASKSHLGLIILRHLKPDLALNSSQCAAATSQAMQSRIAAATFQHAQQHSEKNKISLRNNTAETSGGERVGSSILMGGRRHRYGDEGRRRPAANSKQHLLLMQQQNYRTKMGIKCSVPSSFALARHKCDYDYYFYGALKKSMREEVSSFFFFPGIFLKDEVYIQLI